MHSLRKSNHWYWHRDFNKVVKQSAIVVRERCDVFPNALMFGNFLISLFFIRGLTYPQVSPIEATTGAYIRSKEAGLLDKAQLRGTSLS